MKLNIKKILITAFTILVNLTIVNAQGVNYIGTSAANFLKIGLGARAVGSAGSDITTAHDASSLYWNPGTISRINSVSASFSYLYWLVDTKLGYISATLPTEYGTAGLDITYFSSGDMEVTTLAQQDGTGRYFNASDYAIGLAFAKNFTDRFSVGLKVKYINESISTVSANSFAFDIGSVFTTSFLNDLQLGITLSNFGSQIQFTGQDLTVDQTVPGSPTNKVIPADLETDSWSLPLYFQIGATSRVVKTDYYTVTLSAAIIDQRDYTTRYNVGGEVEIFSALTLRGGYRFNNNESNFSAGAGVNIKTDFAGLISVDYAFTQYQYLNSVQQFTLSLNF